MGAAVVVILQARMRSNRFPGKVLAIVNGRPLLSYQLERLKSVQEADLIIVATSNHEADNPIERLCKNEGVPVYRGSEENVLERYFEAAKKFAADYVVRVTGDCPLLDPHIIDEAIQKFLDKSEELDYLSNTQKRTYPKGMDVEVFSFKSLEKAFREATSDYEREHVTPYLYSKPGRFRIGLLIQQEDQSNYRLVVDTPQDFYLIEKILLSLYPKNPNFTSEEVVNWIDQSI